METRNTQLMRWALLLLATIWMLVIVPLSAAAAPYAAMVMDARDGKVLHSRNADTRLHPASLTKMMTLYVVFEAIQNGEIGLDTPVKISANAAAEPPSKLGLRAGQTINLRYLIRAAAVRSANDASTALAEAIEGSEEQFARRMNRTAQALGMSRTTFKNAHGLTQAGHLSTARDMTIMGRHLFYDYPQYYNLFSRLTADAGISTVSHTNRQLLQSYRGADGIKTGYTRAAGFNLTASAERNGKRIIATVFGGRSVATRNARVAELLDMGFQRAPSRVAVRMPTKPPYLGKMGTGGEGSTVRHASAAAVTRSLRPQLRPAADAPALIARAEDIEKAILVAKSTDLTGEAGEAQGTTIAKGSVAEPPSVTPEARPDDLVLAAATVAPKSRSDEGVLAAVEAVEDDAAPEIVSRVSTSSGRHWGINVGRYPNQYEARKVLLTVALNEMSTLDGSLRKVVQQSSGFDANFMGMTRDTADLACRRLQAKQMTCFMIGPG